VLASLVAGIVEELVVLGYLVHRLEQLGWRAWRIVVAAVVVRVSFHLDYGAGSLRIALWATVTVLLYLRLRRLLPFILAHALWDVIVFTGKFSQPAQEAVLSLVLAVVLWAPLLFVLRRWIAVARTPDTTMTRTPASSDSSG
jgi:membrane protease YdiL (CAAX protease family)